MGMTRTCFLLAAIVAACPFQVACARADDLASEARHRQVDAIFAPWSGRTGPGCAVAVAAHGVTDYVKGYGMSNLEYGVPIGPATVFQTGSIAKQFTAFAIGLLAQEGKLSLRDDIRLYLPEMPDFGKAITIADLMYHTDGFREQGQLLNFAGWRGDDLYTETDILDVLRKQRRLNFDPGSEVVYGNAAYTLLGVVVQRVSGRSLRAFADERIFNPLGMTQTHFRDDHTQVVPGRASAYSPRPGGGWQTSVPNIDHYGSTSLLTTVGDMLKWEQNLVDARVGGHTLVSLMQTSGALNDGTLINYGGGLRLQGYRGLRVISHDGADGGYRAEATLFPDEGLAVVALCNGSMIAPSELTRKVAELYVGQRMKVPALRPAVSLPDALQSAWAGVYWSPLTDEVIQLEWTGGALRQVGTATALVPIGHDAFRPSDLAHEWQFVAPAAGEAREAQPELKITDFWPTPRVFTRVAEPMPGATELASLVGDYRSEETGMTYAVRAVGSGLHLTWPRQYDLPLEPVGGSRFVSSRGTVTFSRDPAGKVEALTISNRRLRRLQAQRLANDS
jgi:CubicO group peptidase (beta-lactamase class C family)